MQRKIMNCISTIDELASDRQNLAAYTRLGIGVEIQDFTEPNLSDQEISERVHQYQQLFRDFKQPKALHGPFLDLKPSSPDLQIRAVSQQRYLKTLQIATELEMDFVIFHSQIDPNLHEPRLAQLNNQQSRDAWLEILAQAQTFKGTILLENVFEKTPAMLKALIETIDLPNVKINLDVGHCKLGDASLLTWISELQAHIAYIHLHSNNGLHDLHAKAPQHEFEHLLRLLDHHKLNPAIALEYRIDHLEPEIMKLQSLSNPD